MNKTQSIKENALNRLQDTMGQFSLSMTQAINQKAWAKVASLAVHMAYLEAEFNATEEWGENEIS